MGFSLLTVNHNSFPEFFDQKNKSTFENQYGLVWLKRGSGSYAIDFQQYKFQENSLILITQNQNACFYLDQGCEYCVITFAPNLVSNASPDVQKLLSFCIREHFEGKQILSINQENDDYLWSIFVQMQAALVQMKGSLRAQTAYHLLHLLLVYCNDLRQAQSKDHSPPHVHLVQEFTSLLEKDYKNNHKVNYYVENLNITYNGLSNYTNDYCGKTPKEIIVERLLLEMKRLLASTNSSVKEIAYDLGFNEPTNMIKYFKKYTGHTPAQFRETVAV